LMLSAYWIGDELLAFANSLFSNFPTIIH
jgi:type III secretory pathway component EscS